MSQEVEKIKPYQPDTAKKEQIEKMFDNIALKYDFLNHFLSAGIDILWRKRAIRSLKSIEPKIILDMATGTGDFAFEALVLNPERIVAIDLSQQMLNVGIEKSVKRKAQAIISFEKGDSEQIAYSDNSFDAITVGFGVRNFENLEKGLSELRRVLRPGGKICILEPSFPQNPILKTLFSIHFKYITPLFGKLFSKDASAYEYLPESVGAFPERENFCRVMEKCGFVNTKFTNLTFGVCTLFEGGKA